MQFFTNAVFFYFNMHVEYETSTSYFAIFERLSLSIVYICVIMSQLITSTFSRKFLNNPWTIYEIWCIVIVPLFGNQKLKSISLFGVILPGKIAYYMRSLSVYSYTYEVFVYIFISQRFTINVYKYMNSFAIAILEFPEGPEYGFNVWRNKVIQFESL